MNHATHFDASLGLMRSAPVPEYARDFVTPPFFPAAQITEPRGHEASASSGLMRVAVAGWVIGFIGAVIFHCVWPSSGNGNAMLASNQPNAVANHSLIR